jgi:hypothetical protein
VGIEVNRRYNLSIVPPFGGKYLPDGKIEIAENRQDGRVDALKKYANLVTPLNSGSRMRSGSFYVHLGLQIGLNFVPVL